MPNTSLQAPNPKFTDIDQLNPYPFKNKYMETLPFQKYYSHGKPNKTLNKNGFSDIF